MRPQPFFACLSLGRSCFASLALASGLAFAVSAFSLSARADEEAHGHDAADGHAAEGHAAAGGHAEGHGEEINWYYGFFSESDDPDVEEDLIVRKKGRPVPFLSFVLNAALLFTGIALLAKRPVNEGLKTRRTGILRGIDEASKMKSEAEAQLAMYTDKLRSIDTEIERVRREMAESAAAERARIVADAKARRERMEREARELVEHELEAMREELMQETAKGAVNAAREMLQGAVNDADHDRLTSAYVGSLKGALQTRGRV